VVPKNKINWNERGRATAQLTRPGRHGFAIGNITLLRIPYMVPLASASFSFFLFLSPQRGTPGLVSVIQSSDRRRGGNQ
jgi:hypothetical protein